ncbi:hypothetical protein H6G32_23925 [Cylindrospermum sp. FACHB-282]|nr:hypothetical protein [Cylindrospermum sp. FACHB-282]
MNQESQNRLKHFAALKSKYQVTQYEDSSPSSLLYLILRKIDQAIELNTTEIKWLKENKLEFIYQEQQNILKDFVNLGVEFSELKNKYKATNHGISWQASHLYFILWKIDAGNLLTDSEINWLKSSGLSNVNAIAQEMNRFSQLKSKYRATQYQNSNPESPLYKILKKLDQAENLIASEHEWLKNNKLLETIEILSQKKSIIKAQFAQLKDKYQAVKYSDLSLSSPLYLILQKIDVGNNLSESEIAWLEQQELSETIAIAQELEQTREFADLKFKYKATQHEDSSPKSHLYKVLKKIDLGNQLGEQDINFLKKRKFTETIEIANNRYASHLKKKVELGELLNESELEWLKNNGREDIIIFARRKHFAILKKKYSLIDYGNSLPLEILYTIMIKLENKERLEPLLIVQLIEKDMLSRNGKIAIAHYRLEAEFLEQEIKRTGHKWHIPTASSYWRKANEPEQALQLTNLDLDNIKDSNLKSAISVTRGGAFRDISNLLDAEKCARKAITYHPSSHHPYTLMGAISYDRYDYLEGDKWFKEAIKRGADIEDIDSEIKRVVKNSKDESKRQQVVEYLLKKDPKRYAWAKAYSKNKKDQE